MKFTIANWAAVNASVKKVYIFGSRARPDWQLDSDLDIAVELNSNGENSVRRHSFPMLIIEFADWVFEKSALQESLQKRIPHLA